MVCFFFFCFICSVGYSANRGLFRDCESIRLRGFMFEVAFMCTKDCLLLGNVAPCRAHGNPPTHLPTTKIRHGFDSRDEIHL